MASMEPELASGIPEKVAPTPIVVTTTTTTTTTTKKRGDSKVNSFIGAFLLMIIIVIAIWGYFQAAFVYDGLGKTEADETTRKFIDKVELSFLAIIAFTYFVAIMITNI